jgi:copper oxidase (laccase) domain-containing protein
MSEYESYIPPEVVKELNEGKERIEGGIWEPGIFDEYEDEVAAAASTKLLRRDKQNALRVFGYAKRFQHPDKEKPDPDIPSIPEKMRAGRILAQLRDKVAPETDLHRIVKTQLVNKGEVKVIDEEFVSDLVKGNIQNKEIAATDAMVTNIRGLPLYISASDCAPVGVYDPENKAIGAFHNGIHGLIAKVSENGIQAMMEAYGTKPENLKVAIAPGVSQDMYVISQELLDSIREKLGDEIADNYARPGTEPGKFNFDITGAIVRRLEMMGVSPENIQASRYQTDKDNELFPSNRKEGPVKRDNYGFMIALK